MKHCVITPIEFINNSEIGGTSDFLLVLSHLLDKDCTNKYAEEVIKFRESGKEIYLDNGLFENNQPENGKSLLRKAELIGATYVFAPDYLYDTQKTRDSFIEFNNLKKELNIDIKLAYVVQANNPLDYITEYNWAENNSDIDLIGMSILSIPKSFEKISGSDDITLNRIVLMKILQDFITPNKSAHLLGLGSSLLDVKVAANEFPYIISNDTSSAFQNGLFGRGYHLDQSEIEYSDVIGGKVKEKVDFNLTELTEEQVQQIKKNILDLRKIVG